MKAMPDPRHLASMSLAELSAVLAVRIEQRELSIVKFGVLSQQEAALILEKKAVVERLRAATDFKEILKNNVADGCCNVVVIQMEIERRSRAGTPELPTEEKG